MPSTEEKSLRVIEFSGSAKDWVVWSEKFLARGKRKGYTKLLLGRVKIPTQDELTAAEDGNTDAKKKVTNLGDLNELGYEDLILSINGETAGGKVAFSPVKNCKTPEFPEGNCKQAWDRLVNKYAPKTAASYIKLKETFTNSSLGSPEEDPDCWLTELESLCTEIDAVNISSDMSDIDFITHVLQNLPEEYEVVVESLESRLEDTTKKLEIEEVRTKLNARFARMSKQKEKNEDEMGFQALTERRFPPCKNCGKHGHPHWKCPQAPKNGMTTKSCLEIYTNKLCSYCGKPGHKFSECRLRKKNGQEKNEKANMAKSVESVPGFDNELGFVCLEVTKSERSSKSS